MATLISPVADAVAEEKARLQGAWEFLSGQRAGQMLFAGDHFLVRFRDGDTYVGTYRLDPTGWPKTIDMVIEEGPAHHRGKTSLGLYKLEADTLRLCPGDPGKERARNFPTEADGRCLDLFFRREKT